ncbi:PAP/OAS1 substrate-binding domain superfamily [Actinidia rufa]|uniref:PAP/OAS1 substrate-binding domain superfamily n=1 Tax=Actinidia rufa TaxID=165716 RepID=A0A7J0FSQ6_9ERIC|nr:PAP/OAS1 substrate-binding domain superfamily [Actinidia rufa]
MGDLHVCSRLPNGVVTGGRPFGSSLSLPLRGSNPDPSSIGEDNWVVAEETTQEVICCIHPTLDSEEKRRDVIDYVQRLIRCSLGFEVFPYGSVPLKTYLPDGDIDLTALSSLIVEETLARDVITVLQGEEQNDNAEYEVKDTQFIDAEVLYRFLDYFSKFDWDSYCISLNGPVSKSSLPDIVGNFYRIRSAFKYGARKLGQIFLLPRERIADEIKMFFSNTMERHGRKSGTLSSSLHSRTFSEEEIQLNFLNLDLDNNISGDRDNELDRYSMRDDSLQVLSKVASSTDGISVSGSHQDGEVRLRNASDTSDCSPSSCDLSNSLSGLCCYAPYFYFSGSSVENGKLETKMLDEESLDEKVGFESLDSWEVDEDMGFEASWMEHGDNHLGAGNGVCSFIDNHDGVSFSGSGISSPNATISDDLALDFREKDFDDIVGSPETLNPLSDLSGDYDSHIRSLLYGQCCHGYAFSSPVLPSILSFPSQFRNTQPLDTGQRALPLNWNASSQFDTNGAVLGPTHNLTNTCKPYNYIGLEEKDKPRGTGTYIPNLNDCSSRERSPQKGGSTRAPGDHRKFQKNTRSNGFPPAMPEKKMFELARARPSGKSELYRKSRHDTAFDEFRATDFSISSEELVFGSFGQLPEERCRPASKTCLPRESTPILMALKMQTSKTVLSDNQQRVTKKSFHLKNEEDFPPLTI